ncbi:phosphopantetheine-binding protein [Streptomyces diastatochromogenes]|uniref:phosphopantetheine-binding protein n=1 Tax=Streptomyces diastatochromogenes TaxID=42236 RepID=UPI00369E1BC3
MPNPPAAPPTHWEHRLVAVGAGRDELLADLRNAPVAGSARVGEPTRFAMVFGPTVAALPWQELYEQEPAFAREFDAVDAAGRAVLGRPVGSGLLQGENDPVATVAAQLALAALWRDLGLRPEALVGRGTGELAAAHLAGGLSLHDALAAADGRTSPRLPGAPEVPLFLSSGPADLSAWRAGSAAAFGPPLAEQLLDAGVELLVDAGLTGSAGELSDLAPELTAATANGERDPAALVRTVAALHTGGALVDWTLLLAGRGRHGSAPGYPWQHRRHWFGAAAPEASDLAPVTTSRPAARPSAAPAAVTAPEPTAVPAPAAADADQPVASERPALVIQLLSLSPRLREQLLLDRVLGHVTAVLGEESGPEVDPDRGFFDLGMDSVMAVALKALLDEDLGLDTPQTLTFECPTSRALADWLLETLTAEPDAAEAAPPAPAAQAEAEEEDLESLTDDELMERLMSGLATSEQLLGRVD